MPRSPPLSESPLEAMLEEILPSWRGQTPLRWMAGWDAEPRRGKRPGGSLAPIQAVRCGAAVLLKTVDDAGTVPARPAMVGGVC